MNTANPALLMPAASSDPSSLLEGVAVGLLAASIGALYTVFARCGIAHGLQSPDLTVLRFGVAGVLTLPVLRGHGGGTRASSSPAGGCGRSWHCWQAPRLAC